MPETDAHEELRDRLDDEIAFHLGYRSSRATDGVLHVVTAELGRLRNRITALEANGSELLAWAQQAVTMTADSREQIERIQAERDAMPEEERIRREALDAPLLRIQLAHFVHWKGRAEQAEAAVERVRDLCHQPYTAAFDLAADVLAELPCRPGKAPESNADAPSPVTAATEAHGETTEAQEG
jgi:uncharacterized protein YigA (DUF484 family)